VREVEVRKPEGKQRDDGDRKRKEGGLRVTQRRTGME